MRQIIPGLWQGDIGDLNVLKDEQARERLKFTLCVNVGSTPFVPRGVPTLYVPMYDIVDGDDPQRGKNDWALLWDLVLGAVMDQVELGGKVLVVCDAGISRSVVFSAMVVSLWTGVPMTVPPSNFWTGARGPKTVNRDLLARVCSPTGEMPSLALWLDAAESIPI